jgi:hypothetical protein
MSKLFRFSPPAAALVLGALEFAAPAQAAGGVPGGIDPADGENVRRGADRRSAPRLQALLKLSSAQIPLTSRQVM